MQYVVQFVALIVALLWNNIFHHVFNLYILSKFHYLWDTHKRKDNAEPEEVDHLNLNPLLAVTSEK